MRFKTEEIERQWAQESPPFALKLLAELMDKYRRWCLDGSPLTVTEFIADRQHKSYHPKGQAFDGRLNDFENGDHRMLFIEFARDAAAFVTKWFLRKRKLNGELQIDPHPELWGKPEQHIHIELDDGNPV